MALHKRMLAPLLGLACGLGAVPAQAEVLKFRAALDGQQGAEPTVPRRQAAPWLQ
jgi:hypothetical protein